MSVRGRRPVPTHLKLVTGNPGRRPIDIDAEPRPSTDLPECPDFLDELARREWDRIMPELQLAGLLTKIDRAALAMYCQAFSRWQLAELKIAELSAQDMVGAGLVVTAHNGYKMLSQWLIISNRSQDQLKNYLAEFGMSPVSRSRVKALSAQGSLFGDDPMEAFLRAGNGQKA